MVGEIFARIKWRQFLIGIVVFIASIVALIFATIFHFHSSNSWTEANQEMKRQQSLNNYAEGQLQIFEKNYPDFKRLQNQGFVGNTKRLQWLETLEQVGEKYRIPGVDFTLESAVPAQELRDHYFHQTLKLETTQMKLTLNMIHEGDWFNLMQHLRKNANGFFSAEKCRISRESSGLKSNYLEKLIGLCDLEWYTIVDFTEEWD